MAFAGIVTRDTRAPQQLDSMLAAMAQEPTARSVVSEFAGAGAWIGWLEAGSDRSRVTSCAHRGRLLVFDGEHFGPVGGIDARTLCEDYDAEGLAWLQRLNGWFAGLIVDRDRRDVSIFTDRLGLRRVYYSEWDGAFAFASEAKALLAIRPECRAFDERGLGELFAIGCVAGDRTLFRNIRRLPGAALWRIPLSARVERRTYIDAAELERQPPLKPAEYREALYAAMERIVPRYFRDSHRAAVSLTGGLDSRAVMAFAGELGGPRRAYTYSGMYREPYDVTIARRVAGAAGFDHRVIVLDEAFIEQFGELAAATVQRTDGTADVLVAHELFLSRLARPIAPVRITGNFGSEIFRGVSQFKSLGLPRPLFRAEFLPYVEGPEASLGVRKAANPISFAIFEELPSRLYGRLCVAQSELTVRTPFTDNEFLALSYRAPSDAHDVQADWIDAIRRRSPALAAIPTDRLRLGTEVGPLAALRRLGNTLLFKAEWHYDLGMRHGLVRADDLLWRHSPPPFAGTHKIEHYRKWLRHGHMLDYISGVLRDTARLYDYLDRRVVEMMLRQHVEGVRNYTAELALMATVALTAQLLIDHPYGERGTRSAPQAVAG